MTIKEMIEQLIEWGKDKEDLEEMNSNELKRLYEELYDEFEEDLVFILILIQKKSMRKKWNRFLADL